jgi:hypothetical protein
VWAADWHQFLETELPAMQQLYRDRRLIRRGQAVQVAEGVASSIGQ